MSEMRLVYLSPEELEDNPANWRKHPGQQRRALEHVLNSSGWAGAALYNERTKRLIDGHLRKKIAAERGEKLPVLIGSWSEAEEREILVTLDPIAGMAETDPDKLRDLLAQVTVPEALLGTLNGLIPEVIEVTPNQRRPTPVYSETQILDEALAYYARTGFPYPRLERHECMQEINRLATLDELLLVSSSLGYGVADTYHPHRYAGKANTFNSPLETFRDPAKFRLVLQKHLTDGDTLGTGYPSGLNWLYGTQACANFRPGFALKYYRRYAKGGRILDTSSGYGGRLVGFIAYGQGLHYTGIDPNTDGCEANLRMARDLGVAEKVTQINKPAEDVKREELGEPYQLCFTSPPYFNKERYTKEPTQSYLRYPKVEAWVSQFLEPMMALQASALVPNGVACVVIADIQVGSKTYPLVSFTIQAAKQAGLTLEHTDRFPMARLPLRPNATVERERYETVLVFRKGKVNGRG